MRNECWQIRAGSHIILTLMAKAPQKTQLACTLACMQPCAFYAVYHPSNGVWCALHAHTGWLSQQELTGLATLAASAEQFATVTLPTPQHLATHTHAPLIIAREQFTPWLHWVASRCPRWHSTACRSRWPRQTGCAGSEGPRFACGCGGKSKCVAICQD